MRKAAAGTRRTIKELRTLLVDIYPPDLHRTGLEAALRDLVAPLGPHGIEANLEVDPNLPKAAREVLTARTEARPAAELSARERDVLRLVAEGRPNKLIARELGISEKTVKAHLTSIFQRIGVTDRTQAALWARRHAGSWS